MRNAPFVVGVIILVGITWISSSLLSEKEEPKQSLVAQSMHVPEVNSNAVPQSNALLVPPSTEQMVANNSQQDVNSLSDPSDLAAKQQLQQIASQPEFRADINTIGRVPMVLTLPEKLEFCGEAVPLDDPDVRERLERELYFTAHRNYVVIFYLKRGARYFPEMERILREENAPTDLIYLSAIESDLLPTIRSPKGALGLWQFMPETAKMYNLRVDQYVDERMHLEKATRAAVKYLRDSKNKLGSWTLASAAYNMGFARTSRTIKEQKVNNYYKLHMNSETARYVFRMLAAKIILENPEMYGYHLPKDELYHQGKTKKVVLNAGVGDLSLWAIKNGITYYDLKRYNPWIVSQKLPVGSFVVEIPT